MKIAIIGKPNAGKSTLFNKLIGKNKAITNNFPGTTRDWKEATYECRKGSITLIDTAGLDIKTPKDEMGKKIVKAQNEMLKSSEGFIYLADSVTGITNEDMRIVSKIKKLKKEIILVVNKTDIEKESEKISEFYKLGLGSPLEISALHKSGLDDLTNILCSKAKISEKSEKTETLKVNILGRPNVGKTSFLNKIIKTERFVVSEKPGTTRDINELTLEHKGQKIHLLDTAGMRRRGKIGDKSGGIIEKFSTERTRKSIEESDIAILLIDGEEGITAQDKHIAGLIKEEGKGVILVVNKWDKTKGAKWSPKYGDSNKFINHMKKELEFLPFASLIFVSSLYGTNIEKVLDQIGKVYMERKKEISTPKFNRFVKEITTARPPTGKAKGEIKILYATQTGTNPPHFTFFLNREAELHFSYRRYIENNMRKTWNFWGTPIKMTFKAKS